MKGRKEPKLDMLEPIKGRNGVVIEANEWQKRMLVLRPIPGLLRPGSVVISQASSANYYHSGKERSGERHSVVFQYTLSGCGVLEVDGKRHDLSPGRGFLCYVGDDRIVYHYPAGHTTPWRFLYVTFTDALGVTRALNERTGFVYDIAYEEPLIQQLLDYGRNTEMTIEVSAGAGHVFINSIIAMLADQAQQHRPHHTAQISLVRQAVRKIEENLQLPYNASLLSDDLNISQEHLSRVFRTELGQTPYQYICQTKIYRACEQLKNTNRTISEVAISLGYEPGSHFARLFKRIMGVTPGVYRRSASMPLKPV